MDSAEKDTLLEKLEDQSSKMSFEDSMAFEDTTKQI